MTSTIKHRLVGATGVVALLGAGMSAAVAVAPGADAATSAKLNYNCTATVLGTKMSQGVWTATVTATTPASVTVGAAIAAPKITASVTSSTVAANTLRELGITSLTGTSTANYTFGTGARTVALTIPKTAVPKTGTITTSASGTGKAEVAPKTVGSIVVKIGNFTASLQTYQGTTKSALLPISCTLVAGQNTTLTTIKVVAAKKASVNSVSALAKLDRVAAEQRRTIG
ncbi:DUF6801 domain-containing protein [Rudaeicoccus suwonensis]|uniref:DUF6801 domain-containing protein n=1 Tax=Rudaeicoccus suwonensis TaxID=657409 RepID=A0A561E2V2_9MICO|nr:DUF6801 domain-containing protein [Rudaeicoccus suwonensis]TWE09945.1 hypothetical protein BKA23_2290 [Rudaeicoccus suwonensis]